MTAPTTQVTVRVPAPLVEYADELVAAGRVKSRSAFMAAAMEHERERLELAREIEIYKALAAHRDPTIEAFNESATGPASGMWDDLD